MVTLQLLWQMNGSDLVNFSTNFAFWVDSMTLKYFRFNAGLSKNFPRVKIIIIFLLPAGLPLVMHTGTSWGYGGLLTLLPDVGLGIFSAITGPDSKYFGRKAAHLYIADRLLGEEPWLNHTTACSFPEPWTTKSARRSRYRVWVHSKIYLRWLTTEYSENLLFWSFKHFFLNHLNQILTNELRFWP